MASFICLAKSSAAGYITQEESSPEAQTESNPNKLTNTDASTRTSISEVQLANEKPSFSGRNPSSAIKTEPSGAPSASITRTRSRSFETPAIAVAAVIPRSATKDSTPVTKRRDPECFGRSATMCATISVTCGAAS